MRDRKALMLQQGEHSEEALTISAYGAYYAVLRLELHELRDVFRNTPPHELEHIIQMLERARKDTYDASGSYANIIDEEDREEINKKLQKLRDIAKENEVKKSVTRGEEGYKRPFNDV